MKDSEKNICKFIGLSKVTKIIFYGLLAITLLSLIIGTIFQLNKNKADSIKFDALYTEKETYSYIDVVAVSDWVYEYTYNSNKMTFYVVEDIDGYWSFATIEDKDISKMRDQRLYWDGKTDVAPKPYRIFGQAWPLNASSKTWTELYKVSGVESNEEFENYFGKMYLSAGYNPIEETGWGFYLVAIFTGLASAIMFMCIAPHLIKEAKSIKRLKQNNQLDDAAGEMYMFPIIGQCIIGEEFFFSRRKGLAIPISDIKSCTAFSNSIHIATDSFGEILIENLKPEEVENLINALPLNGETIATVKTKTR